MAKDRKVINKNKKLIDDSRNAMVRLSLAVALLLPSAEAANAQLAINCTRSLQYGSFADCGGGTIMVTPATGKVSTKGCIVLLGTPQPARCSVKNFLTSSSLKIQLTTKATSIKGPGTMVVDQFNIATSGAKRTKTYTSGSLTKTPLIFDVGADLNVGAYEPVGTYSGKMMIKVFSTP